MAHRNSDGRIYQLLDAEQLLTTSVGYNLAIGREVERGIDDRLATINAGLSTALRLALKDTAPAD